MKKSSTKLRERKKKIVKREDREKRDKEFAKLTKPKIPKTEKIVLKRPIYHNQGKQYIVKVPKEVATYMEYKKGDHIKYTLIISPVKTKIELKMEYVKNARSK